MPWVNRAATWAMAPVLKGIANSLAVKFDLYNDAGEGYNWVGLFENVRLRPTPARPTSARRAWIFTAATSLMPT